MSSISLAVAAQNIDTATIARHTFNKHIDSIQALASVSRYRDSLKIVGWSDSLRRRIEVSYSSKLNRQLDSLRSLNVPAEGIANFSDSLLSRKASLFVEVTAKQGSLQKKVSDRYDTWMKTVIGKHNLDSAGVRAKSLPAVADPLQNLRQPTIPPTATVIAGSNLPSGSLPAVPGMPTLGSIDFSSLELSPELSKAGGDLAVPSAEQLSNWDKNLPYMPDPMKQANDQLAEIRALKADPGAATEKVVGESKEVTEATKALNDAGKLKEQNEALKMAEQMKSPEKAVNHFAGKEAALQGAMSQMSKYKKKYHSLGSLSEIKKNDWLPHNGLKGRPFRERFRPGMNVGFKGGDTLLFDFYPNASYRFTGRIEAGLGLIYRVRVIQNPFGFDQGDPVWGMNTFVVVKTFKAIFVRIEMDGNSFPVTTSYDKPKYRDWRWSFYSGIQTNFKISKRLIGNAQMLYSFDYSLKDKFPEQLKARVGVQYKLVNGKR